LNRESVVSFLEELRKLNGSNKIHIICDNAKYMHAKIVKESAEALNIHLDYLPAYSPNLNLIERYWGFLKKRILMNRHYETFALFKTAILEFSKTKCDKIREELLRYIPERFHLFDALT